MRILLRLPDALALDIHERISSDSDSAVNVEQSTSTAHVLENISEFTPDLLVIAAHPDFLKPEILGACDLFGIRILALTDGGESVRYAGDLGLAQHIPQDASWSDMLAMVNLAKEPAPEGKSDQGTEPPGTLLQDAPMSMPIMTPVESKVIAVWGPTGAPGRTTVAIALANELARQGRSVLLVDADSYGGTISLQLGLGYDSSGLATACRIAHKDALTKEVLEGLAESTSVGASDLHVLTGISDSSRWPELSESRMTTVIALARDWFDVLVIDVGFNLETDEEISSDLFAPRRNAATLTALRDSDAIVAVCGADSVSLARFMRMIRELKERCAETPLTVVVNKATNSTHAKETQEVLGRFAGIEPVAVFPLLATKESRSRSIGLDPSKEFQAESQHLSAHLGFEQQSQGRALQRWVRMGQR